MTVTGTILASAGTVGITDAGPLTISGLLSGQNGVTIDPGPMTVSGTIVSSAGTVGITDSGPLVVSGVVSGAAGVTQTVTGGDMTLSGLIESADGAIVLTANGVLALTSAATITSPTSILLNDTNAVTLGGLLSAPRIVVDNTGGTTTVLPGTQVQTGGEVRPTGTLSMAQLPTSDSLSMTGLFVSTGQYNQTGTLTVTGTSTLVRIDSTGAVQISNGAIVGHTTWLILNLSNGGEATGGVDVENLDLAFTGPGTGSQLSGLVAGLGGDSAAGVSGIVPQKSGSFEINGCPIGSTNCVLITTMGVPAAPPLRDILIGTIIDPTDDDDLLLPLVSDEEY
jgi:hypothetical protein